MVLKAMMPEKLTTMLVVGVSLSLDKLKLTRVMTLKMGRLVVLITFLVAAWTSEFTWFAFTTMAPTK